MCALTGWLDCRGRHAAWKSRAPGRPAIPVEVQRLIATMATSNRTWGEERIANELPPKLGIRVSPRTVWRYVGTLDI